MPRKDARFRYATTHVSWVCTALLFLQVATFCFLSWQAAEAKVRAAQKELHRKRTKGRADDAAKKHVELAKIRLLKRGLTPPAHGLEQRNGFASFTSHEASPAAVPGPGAYTPYAGDS